MEKVPSGSESHTGRRGARGLEPEVEAGEKACRWSPSGCLFGVGFAGCRNSEAGNPETMVLGTQNLQAGEVAPEVSAIDGGEPVALHLRMGCDEEIRDKVLPRPSLAAVLPVDATRQVGRGGREVVIGYSQRLQLRAQSRGGIASGRKLGENHRTNAQMTRSSRVAQQFFPSLVARLLLSDGQQDGGIDGGSHPAAERFFGGNLAGPRKVSRTLWLVWPA